jgi:hypothetical protein
MFYIFAETIQTSYNSVNELPQEIVLDNKFYDEFFKVLMSDVIKPSSISANDLSIDSPSFGLKNWDSQSYLFSLVNIVNLNNLFLEPFNQNSSDYQFMFDFSFAVSGMLIIIFALFFKLALAPFHLWSPDVYEGSPTPVVAFLSVGSKTAGFALAIRLLVTVFPLVDE